MEELIGNAPDYSDILNNKVSWFVIKYFGSIIGARYNRYWWIQAQYMINAYIGEHNDLEMLNDPAIQEFINNAIDEKRSENIALPALYLKGTYKFNPYPNDHEKFDEVAEINPKENVSDIIHSDDEIDESTIYDIDSKNTAEGGQGTDKFHRADMIAYNDQDTGEVTIYLAKLVSRALRNSPADYVEICKIPGPKNYKRITFINGYPRIVDFAEKNINNEKLIIPKRTIDALKLLKSLAQKNKDYVLANLDTYGQSGVRLAANYKNFIDNAIDVISLSYQVAATNIKNRAMYDLRVVFINKEEELEDFIFRNLSSFDINKLQSL